MQNSKVKMQDQEFIDTFEFHEEDKPYNIRHRCFYFSKNVIDFIKSCQYEKIYHSLFDQLIRSATSIGANVLEGKQEVLKKTGKIFLL